MNIIYISINKILKEKLIKLNEEKIINKLSIFTDLDNPIKLSKYIIYDIIFIDLHIMGENPIQFSRLRQLQPKAKFLLITNYKNPALGIIKNTKFDFLSEQSTKEELLRILRNSKEKKQYKSIYFKTIPTFKLYLNNKEIQIKSHKPKELLAILIDANGNPLSKEAIIKKLWPTQSPDNYNLLRNTYSRLKKILEENNIHELIKRDGEFRYADKSMYNSDLQQILDNINEIKTYNGQYLEEYTWTTKTKTNLNKLKEQLMGNKKENLWKKKQ